MKIIVDEMPKYTKDCLFAADKYSDATFIKCKITNNFCELYFKEKCPCLLEREKIIRGAE